MAPRPFRAPLLALALLASLAAQAVAAPPPDNVLSNGSVTPSSGTTATTFTFTVDYSGTQATVTASVANLTVPMKLVSGSGTDGTFRGSAKLPAGRYRITFNANTVRGKDASLVGPVVTVLALATPQPSVAPTPRPTAAPTPLPTPAPPPLTATPLPPGGGGSPTPGAGEPSASGFLGGFLETPIPTATAAESAGGGSTPGDELWTLAMGGLIAISVLAFVAMVAILRNRSVADRAGPDLSAFFGDADGDATAEESPIETVAFVPRNPDE